MQVVNFFNCRKIYDEIALWTGILNNKIYLLILAFIVLFQWIIVTYISIFFKAYNYNGLTIQQWLIGWAIALCGIPLSLLTRLIPYGKEENPVQPSDDNYLQITMQEHSGAHEKTIKTHHTIPKQH